MIKEVISREIKKFERKYGKCEHKLENWILTMISGEWIRHIWFHENGEKESIYNYKKGKKEGKQYWFHENGNREYIGNYKKGKKDGKQLYFLEDGELEREEFWKDGVRVK